MPKNPKLTFFFNVFTCLLPLKIIFMPFYSVFLLEKWILASAGLKIKLRIFRMEHIIHHSSWTRLLQPNTEMWEMLQRPHNRVFKKSVRDTPERWVLVPMMMPMNYQAPLILINSGYLTFQVFNCRKQILTQGFLHFNFMLTQKIPFYGKH